MNFLILGSKHPTVLFTDHKPVIFLFAQKSNPNHKIYRFQLILMKFPNLHIVWTAGKNLALPDTLSRNTPPELLTRKTAVGIPQNIKFFLAKDETSPRLQYKYAVITDRPITNKYSTNFSTISRLSKQSLRSRFTRKIYIQTDTILFMDKKQHTAKTGQTKVI